ncbi:MAG: hypothetical protein LQ340_001420 [Diploschistes diacapsis]|nr:MAG: hypothetical protein LQ340_001420 [Diploschistes diacapsis]
MAPQRTRSHKSAGTVVSTGTMAERFNVNGDARPHKHNFDAAYFRQFTWRDREWWDMKRRCMQLSSSSWIQNSQLTRAGSHGKPGGQEGEGLAEEEEPEGKELSGGARQSLKNAGQKIKSLLKKFGRDSMYVWEFGIFPDPKPGPRSFAHIGRFSVKDEVRRCIELINKAWDAPDDGVFSPGASDEGASSHISQVARLVASVPRMTELRMLIQYGNQEPWRPRRQPRHSSSCSPTESDEGAAVAVIPHGLVPSFPYEERPDPHQAVETLLYEYRHGDRTERIREAQAAGSLSGTSSRRPQAEVCIEKAAKRLRISIADLIGTLEFYSYCLGGRDMNNIGGIDLVRPENYPGEWRRVLRRDWCLLRDHPRLFGTARVYGRRNLILFLRLRIMNERIELLEWCKEHGWEFGIEVIDGTEKADGSALEQGAMMSGAIGGSGPTEGRRRYSFPLTARELRYYAGGRMSDA